MKLEPNVNGSPLVTPLKISSTVVGQQKLSKVEPAIPIPTKSSDEHEEDFEHFMEAEVDEDLDGSCGKDANGSESCVETNASVKQDSIGNETGETETEESTASGKKKSVRKKRSLNWEEAERSLLVEIIKPKVEYVENRSVDAKSIKSKRMSWLQVTKQFNSLNFRHRSLEQIQVQWRSMKNSAKKEFQHKNPKAMGPLEGLPMLEFMEEMQKEPIIGGTRSQTRNSTNVVKKELCDDLDEEDDTPLAALPTAILNHSNSEDTQPTSTMAMPSPPTSAESHNPEFHQLCDMSNNDILARKKKPGPKQKINKPKSLLSEPKSPGDKPIPGIGLKIKRQKCEATTLASLLNFTDVANSAMGVSLSSAPTNLNANFATCETKPMSTASMMHTNSSSVTTPPPSPPVSFDEKYKKYLFELIKRARLADIDYARKEHEQKLRFEQQEQDLKIRLMQEQHEQRMRFALREHEARMRVFSENSSSKLAPEPTIPPEANDVMDT